MTLCRKVTMGDGMMNYAKVIVMGIWAMWSVDGRAAEGLPLPKGHVTREIDGWTVRVDERL